MNILVKPDERATVKIDRITRTGDTCPDAHNLSSETPYITTRWEYATDDIPLTPAKKSLWVRAKIWWRTRINRDVVVVFPEIGKNGQTEWKIENRKY